MILKSCRLHGHHIFSSTKSSLSRRLLARASEECQKLWHNRAGSKSCQGKRSMRRTPSQRTWRQARPPRQTAPAARRTSPPSSPGTGHARSPSGSKPRRAPAHALCVSSVFSHRREAVGARTLLTLANDSKQEPALTIVADTSEPHTDSRRSNFPEHRREITERACVVRTPLPEVRAPHAETPSRGWAGGIGQPPANSQIVGFQSVMSARGEWTRRQRMHKGETNSSKQGITRTSRAAARTSQKTSHEMSQRMEGCSRMRAWETRGRPTKPREARSPPAMKPGPRTPPCHSVPSAHQQPPRSGREEMMSMRRGWGVVLTAAAERVIGGALRDRSAVICASRQSLRPLNRP